MERIEIEKLKVGLTAWSKEIEQKLIKELRRMYDREDALIAGAKELICYDEENEMWGYDESKSSNPGLDAMDFIVDLAHLDLFIQAESEQDGVNHG